MERIFLKAATFLTIVLRQRAALVGGLPSRPKRVFDSEFVEFFGKRQKFVERHVQAGVELVEGFDQLPDPRPHFLWTIWMSFGDDAVFEIRQGNLPLADLVLARNEDQC